MKQFILAASLCFACASANRARGVTKASEYKSKDGAAAATKGHATPEGTIVCEDEMPVGSHIPHQVCRYQEDVDSTRQETQDFLRAHPAENVKPGG